MRIGERSVTLPDLTVAQIVHVVVRSGNCRLRTTGLPACAQAVANMRHLSRLTRGS